MADKVDAVGGVFTSAGETLTTKVTAPLVAGATAAVKFADDSTSAINQFIAATGIAGNETNNMISNTERYQEIMNDVYKDNFGESLNDVASAMATVNQNMKYLDDSALRSVTEYAFTLSDTFEYDVSESTRAADALIKNYSVSVREAFNLITQGAQNGLDYSGELIDNIIEYSVQFGKLGFTAEDMFSIFQNGADNGAFNLDKIGDAVKEFSIRAIDGSDTTAEGFKALGMDADAMAAKFAKGGSGAREAFDQVIQGLADMDDPIAQSAAGVNLFGTMWEDLGPEVVTSLSTVNDSIDKSKESMEELVSVKYDDLGSAISALGRTFQVDVLTPIGEKLIPYVEIGIEKVKSFSDWWKNLGSDTQDTIIRIAGVAAAIGPVLLVIGKMTSGAAGAIKTFGNLGKAVMRLTSSTSLLKAGISLLTGPVGIAVAVIAGLAAAGILVYKNFDKVKSIVSSVAKAIGIDFGAIENKLSQAGGKIGTIVEKIGGKFNQLIDFAQPVIDFLDTIFQLGVSAAFEAILHTAENTVESIAGIFDGFMDILDGVIMVLDGDFQGGFDSIFNGIVKIVGNAMNGLVGLVKTPLNAVISLVNKAIDGINGLSPSIPAGVPGVGGTTIGFNIPKIPMLYKGTDNWPGGPAVINEPDRGGEIVDLPQGTRVYPHDESVRMARQEGGRNINITIPKLADSITVREDSDVDSIVNKLVDELIKVVVDMP